MEISTSIKNIQINGTEYAPVGSSSASGNREVVVIDRGWIFAGDVERCQATGDLILHNAVHVFKWSSIGYTGVLSNPKSDNVTLKKCDYPVKVPSNSVIFTNPVESDWGL